MLEKAHNNRLLSSHMHAHLFPEDDRGGPSQSCLRLCTCEINVCAEFCLLHESVSGQCQSLAQASVELLEVEVELRKFEIPTPAQARPIERS